MPITRTSGVGTTSVLPFRGDEFKYKYPNRLQLGPRMEFHSKLVMKILDKAMRGYQQMASKHSEWDEINSMLKAYVHPEELKENDADGGYNKIIVPVSKITLETILTYMMAAFIQDPIWTYGGTGPEDIVKAQLHQDIVNIHSRRYTHPMKLYTGMRDMFAYGIGASHAKWHTELSRQTTLNPETLQREAGDLVVIGEGNDLMEIDPYRLILDPNVPAHDPQRGEFIGWVSRTTYPRLRNLELQNPDMFFNVQYLKKMDGTSGNFTREGSERRFGDPTSPDLERPIDVLWLYVDLIPEEWKLGKGKEPEKWLFALAGDAVIISARPTGLHHGQFPVAVGAPDTDGYSALPISRLGTVHDLQEHVNFLFSSHIENVKRSVNNELIYDPMMLNEKDMLDPKPGKRIRLRKAAWGRGGIDSYWGQIKIQDLTQNNMSDVAFLRALGNEAAGTPDAVRGNVVNQGPRISSAQAQAARTSQLSRLEKDAQLISWQYMRPLGRMFVAHNQQFMTEPVFLDTTGQLGDTLRQIFPGQQAPNNQLRVEFRDLLGGPLDVMVGDGTIPGREDAQSWIQFLQVAGSVPQVLQSLDMNRLIMHIARQLGAKSVDQFINTQVQVLPEEQVQRRVQAGNLVAPNRGSL